MYYKTHMLTQDALGSRYFLQSCVLNLANARVEGMGVQRTMAATLDLANARVEGGVHAKDGGSDTRICQPKHLCARFGKYKGGVRRTIAV